MASRSERFARKPADERNDENKPIEAEEIVKFSPKEEASLVEESNVHKASANALFAKSEFKDAIDTYDQALATCPNYFEYEIAVLKSNIAACHLKLEDWKEAVKSASTALEGLDRLQGINLDVEEHDAKKDDVKAVEEEEADEEIVSEGATKAGPKLEVEKTVEPNSRDVDIERIRAKALMRRAKAKSEIGGWSTLQGAEEDYKALSTMPNLSAADMRVVQQQLRALPPRTKAAQEKETGEMMDKLKQLGNGILKPFGLSTSNFQMVKDEKTGGYSMNFNQGAPTGQ
ncbi:tetratricopeptide repeat protein-like protein 1 [Amylocarpus encephaloides]|uniref:Tetratricopeptide repeat protein-like protein 1 n=1 Tax=Amylocarpus encephaloides TaxID=45428 RepID=A0A9P7YNN5_9HELO|nr:tetratricopeptide repeat protein-like protein 1 [Amylocarpus encephaloides]